MKPEKEAPLVCCICNLPFDKWMRTRVSHWTKEGVRFERCISCGAEEERKKAQEESQPSLTTILPNT